MKTLDIHGIITEHNVIGDIEEHLTPVVCSLCNSIYDLTKVKVNHRYEDCSQFTTPCCNYGFADTREWKSFPDFRHYEK